MVKITEQTSTQKEVLKEGSYLGRCYGVIDLGTHFNPKYNNSSRKVKLCFELPEEMVIFKEELGPQPRGLSKKFTLSLADKSILKPFLKSWIGRDINGDDYKENKNGEKDFDLSGLVLGRPGILSVGSYVREDGKIVNVINGISPLMKGMEVKPQINETIDFDLSDYTEDQFNNLNIYNRKEIAKSEEMKDLKFTSEFEIGAF